MINILATVIMYELIFELFNHFIIFACSIFLGKICIEHLGTLQTF